MDDFSLFHTLLPTIFPQHIYALAVEVMPGEVGEGTPGVKLPLSPRAKVAQDARFQQFANRVLAHIRLHEDNISLNEAPEDVLLLFSESIEAALLFFHRGLLHSRLCLLRPFLFPGMEEALGKVSRAQDALYHQYAAACQQGNPYRIRMLVAQGVKVAATLREGEEEPACHPQGGCVLYTKEEFCALCKQPCGR